MDISRLLEQHDRARQLLLEGEDLLELDQHVASCTVCRSLVARLAEISRLIHDVPEPSPTLRQRILRPPDRGASGQQAPGRIEMLWPAAVDVATPEPRTTVMPLMLVVEADRYSSSTEHSSWLERFILIGRPATTIGRGPDMDIPIWDRSVSRRHAQIEWRDASWAIRDLESTNGTRVNGVRLSNSDVRRIGVGDQIEVGRYARMTVRSILPELDPAGVVREIRRLLVWATQSSDAPQRTNGDSDELRARLVGLKEETVRLRDQLSMIAEAGPGTNALPYVYERLANMIALTESEGRS